jgi:hypothetical protein
VKPFQYLNIRKQFRYKNQGWTMKENTGLDTETFQGYAKLICDSTGSHKLIMDFDDITDFLCQNKFRNKFNWFFNVRFDFEALIKYLDYAELLSLYNDKILQREDFIISYIPKKFFMITDMNNHRYKFFDMYNFVDSSLNKAAALYLNDQKISTIDASRLNTDPQYWEDNIHDIIKYCIKDAELTKRLADYFWHIVYTNMKYYPKTPYSKGRIAEEYFLDKCYIPTINDIPEKVLQTSYESYSGGRFELLQRGFQEHVYSYDISSAYPDHMRKLIDYNKGKWVRTTEKSEDSYSGFYYCELNIMEPYFSPVSLKVNELSIYPNGKIRKTLAKSEIEFIESHFENVDIKIISGVEFYERELIYPLKTEIERLYRWKQREKDPIIKWAVKIFMNSLYGKTIQTAGDENNTGKLFNPMWAAEITASARIKILTLGLQQPDKIIMFSTDSVHSQVPLKIPDTPGLGEFEKDFQGSGVYIMSDVYNLWNEKKQKSKVRGFSVALEKDKVDNEILLKDILMNMKDTTLYKYTTKRVYHLGECLLHKSKRKLSDLNIFDEVEKTVNINGDKKRLWNTEFKNGPDTLATTINSEPLFINKRLL